MSNFCQHKLFFSVSDTISVITSQAKLAWCIEILNIEYCIIYSTYIYDVNIVVAEIVPIGLENSQ